MVDTETTAEADSRVRVTGATVAVDDVTMAACPGWTRLTVAVVAEAGEIAADVWRMRRTSVDVEAEAAAVATAGRTRLTVADVVDEAVAVAEAALMRLTVAVVLAAVATIDAVKRKRVVATAVDETVTTVLAVAFTAPSTPKDLEPYNPVPNPDL